MDVYAWMCVDVRGCVYGCACVCMGVGVGVYGCVCDVCVMYV